MEKDEAQALAHLATVETGLEAWSEQVDAASWSVVVRDGLSERRIADPTLYCRWRDERLGRRSPSADAEASKGRRLLHVLGRSLFGFIGLLAQAISAPFVSRQAGWDAQDDLNEALNEELSKGYGYRRTHPPDARR